MKAAEKCLLIAMRDRLRLPEADGGAGYTPEQCDIELDEMAPAVAGDVYVVVIAGGWTPGPVHNTSGGVNDLIYSASVVVIRRIGNFARDRRRNIFLGNFGNLTDEMDKVYTAIDWSQSLLTAANQLVLNEVGSSEPFCTPLRFAGMDPRPRPAPAEIFGAAAGKQPAGMMRAIHFHGCRRITTKN